MTTPKGAQHAGVQHGADEGHLERNLTNRHIQLIAIGGAIGTGLFMGSGKTISLAGPSVIFVYMIIGFMLASAFPAILVYAQELFPARIGTVSGLFFGLAFGLAGIGAAVLGQLADAWGIVAVYQICSFLPLIGLLAVFLPNVRLHIPPTGGLAVAKA